jgi:hypothetical protein
MRDNHSACAIASASDPTTGGFPRIQFGAVLKPGGSVHMSLEPGDSNLEGKNATLRIGTANALSNTAILAVAF